MKYLFVPAIPQFCVVSKFGNCTHNCVTRFGSTAGNTNTVAKPTCSRVPLRSQVCPERTQEALYYVYPPKIGKSALKSAIISFSNVLSVIRVVLLRPKNVT